MKRTRTVPERLLALALCLVLFVGMMPRGILMARAEELVQYGSVTQTDFPMDVSVEDNGAVTATNTEVITLNYANSDTNPGWWVGIKLEAPADLTDEQLDAAVFTNDKGVEPENGVIEIPDDAMSFAAYKDGARFIWMYGGVTPERIGGDSDGFLTFYWTFYWTEDRQQTVTLRIDASKVILNRDGTQIYPNPNAAEVYGTIDATDPSLTVSGNGTADLKATNTEVITLVNPNSEVNPGWWVGAKVSAPEGLSEAELAAAQFNYFDGNRKSFAVNMDGNNFIWLYTRVTPELIANDNDGILTSVWTFYWNQKSTQTVTLAVDTSKVILLEADGEQVYPEVYGTLSSSYGGTLSGEKTAHTTLTIENADVYLDTTGETPRWFVDVTVHAPEGCAPEDMKVGNDAFTSPYTYQVELKPNTENYNVEYYTVSASEGLTYYWNGVEQKMTLEIVNAKLHKADPVLVFADPAPADQPAGKNRFSNAAKLYTNGDDGKEIEATISYSGSNKDISVSPRTGDVGLHKTGETTITATFEGNLYFKPATASYTLRIRSNKDHFNFDYSQPADFVFGTNGNIFKNPAQFRDYENNAFSSEGIEYKITEGDGTVAVLEGNDGTLKILNTGVVTVMATHPNDENWKIYYSLNIVKGSQDITITGEQMIFTDAEYNFQVDGIISTDDPVITLENLNGLTEADITCIWDSENQAVKITAAKAGSFTLKVVHPGDKNFEGAEASFDIIARVAQSGYGFEQGDNQEIAYSFGGTFVNALVNNQGTNAIIYSSSNTTIATVDNRGVVTLLDSTWNADTQDYDVIYITAKQEADGIYGPLELRYALKITRAENAISYGETVVSHPVGIDTYYQELVKPADIEGEIKYSIAGDEIYTDFDAETGDITFKTGVEGIVTVTAAFAGDNRYAPDTATYTLTKEFEPTPENGYVISGTKGENGWYTSDITIAPENTEEYEISKNGVDGWAETAKFAEETAEGVQIYLRSKTSGGVTAPIHVSAAKIDKTDPTASINYSRDVWGTLLEVLSFGYYNSTVTVTITAQDEMSGVAIIYYNYDGSDTYNEEKTNGKIEFSIDPEYVGQVKYFAKDAAGLKSAVTTDDTTIIVDKTDPVIRVDWNDAKTVEDSTRYYDGEAVATVIINEANFFGSEGADLEREEGIFHTDGVQIDGAKFGGPWVPAVDTEGNTIPNEWQNTITINDEGEHALIISYTDRSQNQMADYTQTIVVDKTAPVITITEMPEYISEETATVTVIVEEKNFDPMRVDFKFESADATEDSDPVMGQWESNEDDTIHSITLTYPGDALYTLTVNAEDKTERTAEEKTESFTLDDAAPINLKINYTADLWGTFLEKVTFGYYDAEVTVTISAEDITSGVDKIFYNYNGEWKSAEPENGKIEFTIADVYRGQVTYYAVDKAGNGSQKTEDETVVIVDMDEPGIHVVWSDLSEFGKVKDDIRYYSTEKAVATVVINEANFFGGEGADIVRQEGTFHTDGVVITGARFDGEWVPAVDEEGNEIPNAWQNTITLEEEGKYDLAISYTDRSQRKMEDYTQTIVIDRVKPEITLDKDLNHVSAGSVEITVTVEEENFSEELVEITWNGNNALETPYEASPWSQEGNKYSITLTVTEDAFYNLVINAKDLAGNAAEQKTESFTLDDTIPVVTGITYSDAVENVGNTAYYKDSVTVTVIAQDVTSGVASIRFAYMTGAAEVGSQTVNAMRIDGLYRASFTIPAQFRGYVTAVATDYCGNVSGVYNDQTHTLVVDNVAPVCEVTYNTPYQTVNNVSYYAEPIQTVIDITEANFDSNDVNVTVTKDGAAYNVNVNWVNQRGTFTLTEDGDYTVNITYTDKSSNVMTPYTSNQLTLDTQAPTIKVTDIEANSANKEEPYSFTITMDDINLDGSNVQAVLVAVLPNEDGNYVTTEIELNDPVISEDGHTYTYTVENLTDDALYNLSYRAMDMAGNVTTAAELDDGKTYGEVKFSINRKGSAFGFGNEYTETVVSQYYVYEVYENVVIVEVNVDPIEDYVVMVNGQELTEGEDYTTGQTSAEGEWSKRTYVIDKNLFAEEGEYNIVVSSTDKAETTAYSDIKNLTCAFVVDKTAPVLTISGLEEGGRYQTNEQTATVIPTDEGGCLYSMSVVVFDTKGNPLSDEQGNDISLRFEMSGEEFLTYLEEHDGKVTFTIPEGLNLQVQIICNDCAVKADGTTNEFNELFERVTVSENQFVIFYANTPLFIGSIVGGLGLISFLILLIKRKKDKEKK